MAVAAEWIEHAVPALPIARHPVKDWLVRPYVLATLIMLSGAGCHFLAYLIRVQFPVVFRAPLAERPLGQLLPLFALAQFLCFFILGLMRDPRDRTMAGLFGRTLLAAATVEVLLLASMGVLATQLYPRSISLVAFALNLVATGGLSLLLRKIALKPFRALLVGDDEEEVRIVHRKLAQCPRMARARLFTHVISMDGGDPEMLLEQQESLKQKVEQNAIDEVVLIHQNHPEDTLLPLLFLSRPPIRKMYCVPSLTDVVLSGKTDGFVAGDVRMLEVECPLGRWDYAFLKRAIDMGASFVLLLLFAPLMLLISIVQLVLYGRPLFYSQVRTGRDGRYFRLSKFRTMVKDAERETGPCLTWEGDPRVTRFGKFLRATRLDELPQLWHVLTGSMSLIGPRPERPELVAKIEKQVPEYHLRHQVKPGLSGLAQVHSTYESNAEEKMRFDLAYIYNYSPLLDFSLMWSTVLAILSRKGR